MRFGPGVMDVFAGLMVLGIHFNCGGKCMLPIFLVHNLSFFFCVLYFYSGINQIKSWVLVWPYMALVIDELTSYLTPVRFLR